MTWHTGPMVALDFEATVVDPTEARIVSACLAAVQAGQTPRVEKWIVDPGVDIPEEATAVHGITTEQARSEGVEPGEVIGHIADALVSAWSVGWPVVVMNAAYDLTLLDCELDRHGLPGIDRRRAAVGTPDMLIVDPLVIDRAVDRYRRGKKRLSDLCLAYSVPAPDHTADGDALAAARVAFRIAERFPDQVGAVALTDLQPLQAAWHIEWADRFETWMRDNVDPDCAIERDWPIRAKDRGAAA